MRHFTNVLARGLWIIQVNDVGDANEASGRESEGRQEK